MEDIQYKLVIVLRNDLDMSVGKMVAQAGHAVMQSSLEARKTHPTWFNEWIREGQKKVALRVSSEDELLKLVKKAESLGLPFSLIRDMGLTELPPGTVTTAGIGPAPSKLVDKVSGRLKLL